MHLFFFSTKPKFQRSLVSSMLLISALSSSFSSNAWAESAKNPNQFLAKPKSMLIAQDDLFDRLDAEEDISGEEFLSEDIEDTNTSSQPNDNLDSFLSDDANLDADPMLEEELIEETVQEPIQQPIPRNATDDLSDKAIANEVRSMQGPNKRPDSKRVKFIKHPNQKHGLYKISADGKYYYKVEESKQKYGLGIKGGAVIFNQLQNTVGGTTVKFSDIYGSSAKGAFYLEYYWSYFKDKDVPRLLKKARVKLGSGLLMASGNGRFQNLNYQGVQAQESYTFLAFPNHIGLHLGLEVSDKQLIVPFVTGALEYLVGFEMSGELSRTKVLGQLGAHVGGGLALSLGWLDDVAKINLDTEFGINESYLTVEFRQNVALQQDFDFTATFLNIGVQLEF